MSVKPEMTIVEAFRSQSSKPDGIAVYGGDEPTAYKIARTYRAIRFDMMRNDGRRYLSNPEGNAVRALQRSVAIVAGVFPGRLPRFPDYGYTKLGAPFINGGGRFGDKLRWAESPGHVGLREVWRADKGVVSWGQYETGEEFKGVVYLLPARSGYAQMVAGYLDPNNDGPAAICFDEIFCGDADGSYDNSTGFRDAKSSAEETARIACESNYEFAENEAKKIEIEELKQTIEDCRKERRDLMRAVRQSGGLAPAICEALRKQVYSIRRESREAHRRLSGLGA
jgi:hypothetical protein